MSLKLFTYYVVPRGLAYHLDLKLAANNLFNASNPLVSMNFARRATAAWVLVWVGKTSGLGAIIHGAVSTPFSMLSNTPVWDNTLPLPMSSGVPAAAHAPQGIDGNDTRKAGDRLMPTLP